MVEIFGRRPIRRLGAEALKAGVIFFLFSASRLFAQQGLNSISTEVTRVFDQAKNAVVRIHAEDEHGRLAGTGFFIDPAGTIVTAYEVGGESWDLIVEFGSNRYPAQRLVADPRSGIALLKVSADTPWLSTGDSDELKLASPVVTIGYPMDLSITPSFGMIGGFDLKYLNQYFSTTLIRVNIAAQRGEAGSPVLNLKGEVVGILIFPIDNRTACYALPIKAAEKVRTDYVRFGEVRPGWVGVSVIEGDEPVHNSTAVIQSFAEGSPAIDSGLQQGDVLLRIGTVEIRSPPDVVNASFFLTAEQDVPITVLRDGKEITVTVTAADHPGIVQQKFPLFAPATLENALRTRDRE
ncbi:MAG TPA: trypsin-like peptidase domain-containing protein [Chthoniobacterales bacterium]|jgi:S1-C subfamily serine protease|nr:trypsin-like peptidase domain-containing protein [Chthoniobacterales bacterium]